MEKILLVEDNEHIMDINARYLTDMGYCVEKAYSARQAEDMLRESLPDLVVLDIMLPDGDGISLCRSIRKYRSVPILFLTAKVTENDIIAGLENGGDDYLTKPYDLNVFGTRVRALLRRAGKILPENQSYTVGPLLFDIVRSQASVGGIDLNLSSKEFGILLFLAQHRGMSVSKEELYRSIWGYENESDGSALWTTVSRLKKKIESFEDLFYIDSDHDGYELVVISHDRRRGR